MDGHGGGNVAAFGFVGRKKATVWTKARQMCWWPALLLASHGPPAPARRLAHLSAESASPCSSIAEGSTAGAAASSAAPLICWRTRLPEAALPAVMGPPVSHQTGGRR